MIRNEVKITEKIINLRNHLTEFHLRNSFIRVQIKKNGHTTKSFLAYSRKEILYIPDNTKIIHEIIPKNKNEWIEKTTEITEINNKKCSSKIRKKDLMYMVETNKSRLINSKTEFYIEKKKIIYTLPDKSKIVYELYPDKNNMVFSEIED